MYFYSKIFPLTVIFCAFTATVSAIPSVKHASDFNFKNLPAKDQLGILLAYKLSPRSFKSMPEEILAEISDYSYLPFVDSFFIDAKQLFVQVSKIAENATLPEFNWEENYNFCVWIYCIDLKLEYSTKNSSFIGTNTISTSTEVTSTSFEHSVHIPFFNWTSPDFLVTVTDYGSKYITYYENCHWSLENVTLAFQADYLFVPNIGIQLANASIHFNADRVRGGLKEASVWDHSGNLVERYELDPTSYPIEEGLLDMWNTVKRRYTYGLEYSLNCFLSNGRSDPENCIEKGGWGENEDIDARYYHLLNMQFIQTVGLSALVSE